MSIRGLVRVVGITHSRVEMGAYHYGFRDGMALDSKDIDSIWLIVD